MANPYSDTNVLKSAEDRKLALEGLIDATSASELAGMAEEVCEAKAEHIRENWQDEKTARFWDYCAAKFRATRQMIEKR